jgi:Icc-related predicted phosphoesterase
MRFLAFGDVVENKEALEKLSELDFSGYDFVLFTGDILTLLLFKKRREKRVLSGEISENEEERRRHLKESVEEKEILQKEAVKLQGLSKFFKAIKDKAPLYGVWGNADHRWIVSQTDVSKYITNLHLRSVKIGGFNFIGYEGRPKYIFETYENPTERAFDEEKAFKQLSGLFEKIRGKTIFVTHAPPYKILDQVEEKYRKYAVGTYGEKASDGNIGSLAFKKIVEKFRPLLHVFGHVHECKGMERTEETVFVNSGSLGKDPEYVEIRIDRKIEVEFVKL